MKLLAVLLLLTGVPICAQPAGGALTHQERNRDAFAQPAPGLTGPELRAFTFGNRIFNTQWLTAPASVDAFDGLGPTFNRSSCSGCHLRDGRGQAPATGAAPESMLVRWSIPGRANHGQPKPVPAYGEQLNDRAIEGVAPEARLEIEWRETEGRYADGTPYRLRRPVLGFREAAYGPLPKRLLVSARVAPAMIGMGLLDAIPASDLQAAADPHDRNGDGISGRLNWVYDPVSGERMLGRFGWKAGVARLMIQAAAAAHGDIGLSSPWFPEQNCPREQRACRRRVAGGEPELSDAQLQKLTLYLKLLGVPGQRNQDQADVRAGASQFRRMGCTACHQPAQTTAASAEPLLLAAQTFLPYTDLLLHDMGSGLADGRPEFEAGGREWRTAPLWGIGLIPTVNGHQYLLHDGRARGVAEAILWHGGEAQKARDAFVRANGTDRAALIAFVNSL